MSRSKEDLHAELVRAFDSAAAKFVYYYPHLPTPFLTCTNRSNEDQNSAWAQGRTTPGKIVTNAKAGQSPHNYFPSLAFDIGFLTKTKPQKLDWSKDLFKKFAAIIKAEFPNVVWGGDFESIPDPPHFELRAWKQLKEVKQVA